MAGWRKATGQLCSLLGLSLCRPVIKSRPWCEAFCWSSSGPPSPEGVDNSLRKYSVLIGDCFNSLKGQCSPSGDIFEKELTAKLSTRSHCCLVNIKEKKKKNAFIYPTLSNLTVKVGYTVQDEDEISI